MQSNKTTPMKQFVKSIQDQKPGFPVNWEKLTHFLTMPDLDEEELLDKLDEALCED